MSALDPLSVEQREIRELVRVIARERVAPRAAEIDKSADFPWDVVEAFRENDLFGVLFAEEFGGIGESSLLALVVIEELSKVCATSGLIVAVQELGSLGIKLAGSPEQKGRFLPKLASGEWLAAYALTEAGSGSDSAAMRSTAVREADEYVLERGEAVHHECRGRVGVCGVREDRPAAGAWRHLGVRRRGRRTGARGGADRAEDGDQGLDDGRVVLQRLPGAGGQSAR